MKTITSNFNTIKSFLGMILLGVTLTANAQGFTKGNIYVHNNGEMHVAANNFEFGTSGTTATTRTTVYGKLSFAAAATWTSASNTHHVNGYVKTYKGDGSRFVFPIGNGTMYAPAAVKTNVTTGVDAAYLRQDPASDTSTDGSGTVTATPKPSTTFNSTTLDKVSSIEYWHIVGTKTEISLTWRASSNISSTLTNSLADLTIAGWNGSQWVAVDSEVDVTSILTGASSLTAGSITSKAGATLTYTYYTLAAKDKACMPLVAMTGATRTFNGTSWDTIPTEIDNAVVSAPGSPGSFVCNSLSLGANNITLTNGQVVEVVNGVTGTGKIIMSSEASFVQRNSASAAPAIELNKLSRNMRRWEYIYWGTPIAGNFFSQIANAKATSSSSSAFQTVLRFDATALNTSDITEADANTLGLTTIYLTGTNWFSASSITTGQGFSTRVLSQAPYTTAAVADKILFPFVGTANNGDVTATTNFVVLGSSNSRYNLVANPYPSALDAVKLVEENKDKISGTVYFWTNSNVYNTGSYAKSDYATFATGSQTGVSPMAVTPTKNIGSAQGFMVRRIGTVGPQDIKFTNCMRVTDASSNNIFFRTNSVQPNDVQDRFWVNLTAVDGAPRQIAVTYIDGLTNGYEDSYDAPLLGVTSNKLYTLIDNGRYAINARPAFNISDAVALGYTKEGTSSETFTFSLHQKEGVFNENVDIYIHDKALNVYHNLSQANYTFNTDVAVDNSRFEIVYQTNALNNPDFTSTSVVMLLSNSLFSVQAKDAIENIQIYDLAGRVIESYNAEGNNEFQKSFIHEEGIYIAKAKMVNGSVVSQKLINLK